MSKFVLDSSYEAIFGHLPLKSSVTSFHWASSSGLIMVRCNSDGLHRRQHGAGSLQPNVTFIKQCYPAAAFESLGLTKSTAERLRSHWLKRTDGSLLDVCEFVIQSMRGRVPQVYLVGLGTLPNFAEDLGITAELLQLAVSLFSNDEGDVHVMPVMVWLESAIRIYWEKFLGDN